MPTDLVKARAAPGVAALLYGLAAYAIFLATFLGMVAFVQRIGVGPSLVEGRESPLGVALAVDLGLLLLLGLHHGALAHGGFERRLARVLPATVERSTLVLATCACLVLLMWQWRPIPSVVWDVRATAPALVLRSLSWAGWGLVVLATFLLDHLELLGVAQAVRGFRGREPSPGPLQAGSLERTVRHPLYLGLFAAFWSTPSMTAGHLLFAAVGTVYILVAAWPAHPSRRSRQRSPRSNAAR